jgi:carbonic anhydrase
LDLQQLLPANQSYVSYAGSLTTPPCTEGVLWIMMLNTQKMSLQQVR